MIFFFPENFKGISLVKWKAIAIYAQQYSYGCDILEKLEKFSRIFKNTLVERVFEKYSLKCDFGKILQEISLYKMKKIFLVRFSCKIEGDLQFFLQVIFM